VGDSLEPLVVEPLLHGRFGRPYLYRAACVTTQELIGAREPEGAVAVCDRQTGGRGRRGRSWLAPAGAAILCSTLLRPPPARRLAQLSLVAGTAVADTVEALLRRPAAVKWPNDVLVDGGKVAGVLLELRDGAVVVGIGMNVNQEGGDLPADTRTPPASLRTVDGLVRERAGVLALLLTRLEERYDAWRASGLQAVRDSLAARDFLRGRRVAVNGTAGVAAGIDDAGRLRIDTSDGLRAVESGEVAYDV
jgi:BirA family biotin operon repressor/biotin-[acetyl-CoA-carboxylase] ligase